MIWIKVDDIILIHSRIIKATGGVDGLRDSSGLEAALAAPFRHLEEKICFLQTWRRLQDWGLDEHLTARLLMEINASEP